MVWKRIVFAVQPRGHVSSELQGQTSNFSCAEPNANEQKLSFLLICIRLGTCKVGHSNYTRELQINFHSVDA